MSDPRFNLGALTQQIVNLREQMDKMDLRIEKMDNKIDLIQEQVFKNEQNTAILSTKHAIFIGALGLIGGGIGSTIMDLFLKKL